MSDNDPVPPRFLTLDNRPSSQGALESQGHLCRNRVSTAATEMGRLRESLTKFPARAEAVRTDRALLVVKGRTRSLRPTGSSQHDRPPLHYVMIERWRPEVLVKPRSNLRFAPSRTANYVDHTWQNKNRIFPVQGPSVTVPAVRARAATTRPWEPLRRSDFP